MIEQNAQKQTKEKQKCNLPQGRLPLTSDYVFKRVFAKDENNSMLKDFLEAILDRKINKVVVKNPEIPKNLSDERIGILDLKLDIDEDKVIDVEMQMRDEHNMKERSGVYLSKLVAEQLKAKQPYLEVKKVVAINLLNFNLFKRNSYHSIARMKFEKSTPQAFVNIGYDKEEEIATDVFEMHFIELPKFIKKNPTCKTKLEQWLWLLVGSKEEMIQMAVEENEEIKKTVEVLDELSMSEEERALYEYREKALLDYIDAMDYAKRKGEKEGREKGEREGRKKGEKEGRREGRREGRKEGKKEGIREAKIEIAKKMLNEKISLEEIMKITGLTKEEIERTSI